MGERTYDVRKIARVRVEERPPDRPKGSRSKARRAVDCLAALTSVANPMLGRRSRAPPVSSGSPAAPAGPFETPWPELIAFTRRRKPNAKGVGSDVLQAGHGSILDAPHEVEEERSRQLGAGLFQLDAQELAPLLPSGFALCKVTEAYPEWPPHQICFHPDIAPTIVRALQSATSSVWVLQCTMDETQYVHALSQVKARNASADCRLVLDSSTLKKPTARGVAALNTLKAWRVNVKVRCPKGNPFSFQHEKSWLVDEKIFLYGNHNGTHNSL